MDAAGVWHNSVDVLELSHGIEFSWEYATDLFDESTIARMSQHFERLLLGIAAEPSRPVTQISMISDTEAAHILADFNAPAVDYQGEVTIHERFEARVAETPDAIAVVHDRSHEQGGSLETLTYAELNAQANRVAHFLQAKGVGVNDLVGIFAARSPRFLVAILGIMKAGAAYVPLDPINPQDRIDYMISNAGAKVLLSEQ